MSIVKGVVSAALAGTLLATANAQQRVPLASQGKLVVPSVQPIADSPIAATATVVFAIGSDRLRLLKRPADLSGPWQVLTTQGEFERLAGLTVNGDTLFVTDNSLEAVFAIDIATGRRTQLSAPGALDDPGSVAFARDLFVADHADGKVYRFRGGQMTEVILEDVGERRPLSLTGSGDDLFVAASDGQISEFRGIGSADPAEPQQPRRKVAKAEPASGALPINEPVSKLQFTLRRTLSRFIQDPSRIAVSRGIVYVIDRANQKLNALSLTDGHPIPLVYRPDRLRARPTSVAVNANNLYVMSGRTLERWPRLVPARVKLRTAGASEAMAQVYDYLQSRGILALRQVPLDKTIESTLRDHKVLVDNYPHAQFDPLICAWNPDVCDERRQIKAVQQGKPILIPDIYSESFIDTASVVLNGKESLGEVADKRVFSDALRRMWTSEARLMALNAADLAKRAIGQARSVREGTFLTPIEYVQYLIPVVPEDAPPRGALEKIEAAFTGVRIVPLEERQALAQGAAGAGVGPSFTELEAMFDRLLARVKYEKVDIAKWRTTVGIAERGRVDVNHPDLSGALVDLTTGAALPSPPTGGDLTVATDAALKDHATMVAALIGARGSKFKAKGLAPLAFLMPLNGNDPAIGDAVRDAQNLGVKLFNVSEHFGRGVEPAGLLEMVQPDRQESKSLFIVAAGNDSKEVCGAFRVYPACWHAEKNVIVVAASNDSDDDVRSDSNFSAKAVHLAAPGAGYYTAGEGRTYVPAKGTSFSTPLVTAAAALVYYGAGITEPWLIKQRLVATADPLPDRTAGHMVGGTLNIRRALYEPGFGVLTRPLAGSPGKTEEQLISLNQDTFITVRYANNTIDQIRVLELRRVHRQDNGKYRIIRVHGDALEVAADVTFPREKADWFLALTKEGASFQVELSRWNDFVAPAQ